MDTFKCCLCGSVTAGWGNNPQPFSQRLKDRCCDACNSIKVIPMRLALMSAGLNPRVMPEEQKEQPHD